MLTEATSVTALKLAETILQEHEQYGTLKSLVPLARKLVGARPAADRAGERPARRSKPNRSR